MIQKYELSSNKYSYCITKSNSYIYEKDLELIKCKENNLNRYKLASIKESRLLP